ncbi:MAG: 4Fe-4S binding protein [Planctomycetota bacterium]
MAAAAPEKKTLLSRLVRNRRRVQAAFLPLWLLPLAGRLHTVCGPVFHCYACPLATFACPIGVIANFAGLHIFPFFAIGMLFLIGGVIGALICGWVCPFGFAQDLLGRVPTPRVKLPAWTGYSRYVVLVAFVLVVPFLFGERHPLFICLLCPAGAIEGAAPQMVSQAIAGEEVLWPNTAKIIIVALLLTAMFFTYRPWCTLFCPLGAIYGLFNRVSAFFLRFECTLFCPLGAIYGLFNRVSAFFLRFEPSACTSCKACHSMCKIGIEPDRRANDPRCIRCLECTRCPTEALTVGSVLAGRKSGD